MVRIRQGCLVLVLGLGLIASCKKDDKTNSAAGGDKSAEKSGGQGGAASSDDLSLLPVDSEIVIGVNLAQVQQSALWKQLIEPKVMAGEAMKKIGEFKAKCGFDPWTAVKSISMGMKGAGAKPDGVVVVHGVDKAKVWPCLDALKPEMTQDGTEYTREGEVALFKNSKGGPPLAMTFVNDSTAIAVIGDKATAEGAKAAAAGGSTLKSSADFVARYKKVNADSSLWLLVSPKALERASLPVKATSVAGSLNVTDGLALDARVEFETPDAAAQAASLANGQAKQAAAFVDKAEFTSDGKELHAAVAMSNQKLQALVAQFAPLLGMMAGGAGSGM